MNLKQRKVLQIQIQTQIQNLTQFLISNSNSNINSISDSNSNTDSSLDSNSNTNSDSDSNSNEDLINTILSINVNSKIIPDSESRTNFHENLNEREKKIIDTLRLDHLNFKERIHVQDLFKKSFDCFHLSGENLEHTNILQHQIPTINETPIHTRQYRFPAIHKDEINKQVNETI